MQGTEYVGLRGKVKRLKEFLEYAKDVSTCDEDFYVSYCWGEEDSYTKYLKILNKKDDEKFCVITYQQEGSGNVSGIEDAYENMLKNFEDIECMIVINFSDYYGEDIYYKAIGSKSFELRYLDDHSKEYLILPTGIDLSNGEPSNEIIKDYNKIDFDLFDFVVRYRSVEYISNYGEGDDLDTLYKSLGDYKKYKKILNEITTLDFDALDDEMDRLEKIAKKYKLFKKLKPNWWDFNIGDFEDGLIFFEGYYIYEASLGNKQLDRFLKKVYPK